MLDSSVKPGALHPIWLHSAGAEGGSAGGGGGVGCAAGGGGVGNVTSKMVLSVL